MNTPSKEDWVGWLSYPETQWFMDKLKEELMLRQENLGDGVTLGEHAAQKTAKEVGFIEALKFTLFCEPVFEENADD